MPYSKKPSWSLSTIWTGIPDGDVEVYYHTDPRIQIELEPFDGYDDGRRHDSLHYYVSVYQMQTYDEQNHEWIDSERGWSRRADTESQARCHLLDAAIVADELHRTLPPLPVAEGRAPADDVEAD